VEISGEAAFAAPVEAVAPWSEEREEDFLVEVATEVMGLPESPVRDLLEVAVFKLTAATKKSHIDPAAPAPAQLAAENDAEAGVLQLCSEATAASFDVLKYDVYHRQELLSKRWRTPRAALDLAQRVIDRSGQLRQQFLAGVRGTVEEVVREAQPQGSLLGVSSLRAAVDALPASTAKRLLDTALLALEASRAHPADAPLRGHEVQSDARAAQRFAEAALAEAAAGSAEEAAARRVVGAARGVHDKYSATGIANPERIRVKKRAAEL